MGWWCTEGNAQGVGAEGRRELVHEGVGTGGGICALIKTDKHRPKLCTCPQLRGDGAWRGMVLRGMVHGRNGVWWKNGTWRGMVHREMMHRAE